MAKYLMVYDFSNSRGRGTGNVPVSVDGPVTFETIREMEKEASRSVGYGASVVLLNLIPLAES